MAEAAGVSTATLRHYFGTREAAVQAVFAAVGAAGEPHMRRAREPRLPFAESVREYLATAAFGLRQTALGDYLAAGLVEGLLDRALGPACVDELLEPTLQSLTVRLEAHQTQGLMRNDVDARYAAIMLFSPMFIACQHQDQLGGSQAHALDMEAFIEAHAAAFTRAFATAGSSQNAPEEASPNPADASRSAATDHQP
jgi:AcrR family transcriptional regulator